MIPIFSPIIITFQFKIISNPYRKETVPPPIKHVSSYVSVHEYLHYTFFVERSTAVIRKQGLPPSFRPLKWRRHRQDPRERTDSQWTSPGRSSSPGSSNRLPERQWGPGTKGPWRGAGAWGGWRGRRQSRRGGWSLPCWGLGRRRWRLAWVVVECCRMRERGVQSLLRFQCLLTFLKSLIWTESVCVLVFKQGQICSLLHEQWVKVASRGYPYTHTEPPTTVKIIKTH